MKAFAIKSGQTLIEAIIAVAVVALLSTGLVAGTVKAIRGAALSNTQSVANKYAQEAVEYIRAMRNRSSWTAFSAYANASGVLWCMNGSNQLISGACGSSDTISVTHLPMFTRTVTFRQITADQVDIIVEVSWPDSGNGTALTRKSHVSTSFTNWNK